MSTLVPLVFVAILACLCTALYFMLKGSDAAPASARKMARALAFRVAFSIALFVCILLAWKLGWIHPTGIPAGR